MALFFNHRKPRPFDYKPRHYSPEQEAREERKKIVLGEKYKAPGEEERNADYVPGSYIREHVSARRNNMQGEIIKSRKRKRQSMTVLAAVLAVLVLIVWLMYFR